MRALALAIIVLLGLTGCVGGDARDVIMKLSESDRSWCVSVTTIYGTLKAGGTGLPAGKMLCNGEGWQVDASGTGGVVVVPAGPRLLLQEPGGVREVDPAELRAAPRRGTRP